MLPSRSRFAARPDSGVRPINKETLICELGKARTALMRSYVLHVTWFAIMCTVAGLHWHHDGIEASVLLTLLTVPPVLFYTVRVHTICRNIDPATPTVGWVPVLVTTFVLSPFESGLILPAKNLFAASRILRAHRASATALPAIGAGPDLSARGFRPTPGE